MALMLCLSCGNSYEYFAEGQVCPYCGKSPLDATREWKEDIAVTMNMGTGKYNITDTASDAETIRKAAAEFLDRCSLAATPDAVGQLTEVFLPCLRIMCERPWDPNGGTWRRSGVLGILTDVRKKFERMWERGWKHGKRHDDSGFDLINYIGFYMRSDDNGWGSWGPPAASSGGDNEH